MKSGLLIIILASLLNVEMSFAGAPGPFESCSPRNNQILNTVDGKLRGPSAVQYKIGLQATESECQFKGVVTGYKYSLMIFLKLPQTGLFDPSINQSPILIRGNLMFKDKSQGNLIKFLSILESSTHPKFEDTYTAGIHISDKMDRIGLHEFVESIRGYSFYLVSDDIPTSRIQNLQ